MYFSEFWNVLHEAHEALVQEDPALQADAINTVFLFLQHRPTHLFPSRLSHQAMTLLKWYLTELLPAQGYAAADRQAIADEYQALLAQQCQQIAQVEQIEGALQSLLCQLYDNGYRQIRDVVLCFLTIVGHLTGFPTSCHISISRQMSKAFARLNENFTHAATVHFFNNLFTLFEEQVAQNTPTIPLAWSHFRDLCEYVVQTYFQGKALFVDTFFQGCVLPLWVWVDVSASSDHVEFVNLQVDQEMQRSADVARAVAAHYLRNASRMPISERMLVRCQFPNPGISYRDTSASLLIGLKIVGEVLGVSTDPITAVTGEIEASGDVAGVGYVAHKLNAVSEHAGIRRMLMPAANVRDLALPADMCDVMIVPVRTFAEAVQQYYGQSLPQTQRSVSRRHILIGGAGLLTIPAVIGIAKNHATSSVTDQDWWNLEYAIELYSRQNNYPKAREILQFLVRKFERETSATPALQLQAHAYEELGWTYTFQRRKAMSFRFLNQSFELWQALNDQEKQAHLLILIGSVFGDSGYIEEIRQTAALALRYLDGAQSLIHPSMPSFHALQGKYYSKLGILYNHLGEYTLAEEHTRKALHCLSEPDAGMPRYQQIMQQHLGRVLVQRQQYDQAFDLLHVAAQSPLLQSPSDQARSWKTLSDLFLSCGDIQEGLAYAERAGRLARSLNLEIQEIGVKKVLIKHHLPLSAIAWMS